MPKQQRFNYAVPRPTLWHKIIGGALFVVAWLAVMSAIVLVLATALEALGVWIIPVGIVAVFIGGLVWDQFG